ncbi:ABC transporter permease [Desulfopila aestuarii]|uniref:Putative ABC transport system permease protein n=1 Tax=Desulfopila aestuarii DSM 18488 TaxID=1121416 RepID=A0A1M7XXA2_9BACT|nr:ABC transporter permease [Desulfopila aestuarii]SHO43514.1 putative ABC transport system permease protein [Desulfopila aestuarii DSM 18488]
MRLADIIRFGFRASTGYTARTFLMLLAMAIGVGSVVVLSSLGESAREYVVNQFSSLGTNLLIVLPGRSETVGGPPPLLGVTPRDLTLTDAEALQRSANIRYVAPISLGAAPVSYGAREREVTILGSTAQLFFVRQLTMGQGRFLPEGDITKGSPVCVLGYNMQKELFGTVSPLGETLRIGDYRFRVIGVLAKKGESVGLDMGDVVIIPVASAQALFNTSTLFRIMVEAVDRDAIFRAKKTILSIIRDRHDGEDDVTVITQDAVLATFDKIFTAMTLTVTGIGAISISVAGILIMNVMLIAVSQRRSEVGLLKAIGAPEGNIITLFLVEAVLLSLVGAVLGLLVGTCGVWVIGLIFPNFPITMPLWSLLAAVAVALVTGLVFGVLPAMRAARLDPVISLSRR